VLNFAQILAGSVIGLMQQVGLIAVEVNTQKKEMMNWMGYMINNMFAFALSDRCLKGNFTRIHRVCLARKIADHVVDQVLHSFSKHKEFNKAFDEVTYAIESNCIEPSGMFALTHTAIRQAADTQFFVMTKTILKELKVPIIPFKWLIEAVHTRDIDFGSEHVIQVREWVRKIITQNQLLFASNSQSCSRRVTPYVSSPAGVDGNVVDPSQKMLRVDHASGTEIHAIAANMLKYFKNFFYSSNIDNETRCIIPALTRHSAKVCDFKALFNMAPICNVRFFLGLFFTQGELRSLPEGLFTEVADNLPVAGQFNRVEKVPEGSLPFTAYGIHIVVAFVLAAFLGTDVPDSLEINSVVATKITVLMAELAPSSMLHPTGKHLHLRGFTGKNVHACELHVNPSTDNVRKSFFLRQRNDACFLRTVNPKPLTLNPKPLTLNPKP
jgi:hypothetical protein